MFDTRAYLKSAEGQARILEQRPFIAGGQILQGLNGVVIKAHESQVSDEELESFDDLDGSRDQILFRRKQRIESRYLRRSGELDTRRAELRRQKNEIRESLKADKDLGINPSQSDLIEIDRIEKRMARLSAMSVNEADQARAVAPVVQQEVEGEVSQNTGKRVAFCGKESPPNHKSPDMWLNGHRMGCKECTAMRMVAT